MMLMDSIQEAGADRGFLPSEDEGTLPGLQQGTELPGRSGWMR